MHCRQHITIHLQADLSDNVPMAPRLQNCSSWKSSHMPRGKGKGKGKGKGSRSDKGGNGRTAAASDPEQGQAGGQLAQTMPGTGQVAQTLPGARQVAQTLPGTGQVTQTLPGAGQLALVDLPAPTWASVWRLLCLLIASSVLAHKAHTPSAVPGPGSAPAAAPAPSPADGTGRSWSTLVPALGLFVLDTAAAYSSCAHNLLRPRLMLLVAVLLALAGWQLGCKPRASRIGHFLLPLVPALLAGEK